MSNAFIGVSLDNKIFLTDWLHASLEKIVSLHDNVLLLLADDLLRYTRTVVTLNDMPLLDFKRMDKRIAVRKKKLIKHFKTSISEFTESEKNKIQIREWRDFEDYLYVDILRNLTIAYYSIDLFKEDVRQIALIHFRKNFPSSQDGKIIDASVQYILDEVAMAIRITELDVFNNEYYPEEEVAILTTLYSDKYKKYGLTISGLINQPPKRTFNILLNH